MKKFLSKVKSLAKRSKVAVVAAVAAVSSAGVTAALRLLLLKLPERI